MLRRETKHNYENTVNGTKFIVESESPENCKEDMVDSLLTLLKKDIEKMSFLGKEEKTSAQVIQFPVDQKTVATTPDDSETR